MSEREPDVAGDELAPVDYLVMEFPRGQVTAGGFDVLLDLVKRGVVEVLDVEFVGRDADGAADGVTADALSASSGIDLRLWDGASSGLLDGDDLSEVAAAIAQDSVAAVVIYENRWVLGVVDAWRRQGARLVTDGGLDATAILATLDEAENH